MECINGYEIKVLKSSAYYIGTLDEYGLPNCRISQEYYPTRDSAEKALSENSFTKRNCVEISFCNGCKNCY